ncbi:hypothetical protein L7F22_047833 [Adiantum nelumboides]|nr:hypothetical protein [Adiantum nelumboides]
MLHLCKSSPTLYPVVRCSISSARICSLALSDASVHVDCPPGGIIHAQDGILALSPISAQNVKQRSDQWHELRHHRLTASSFSTALGFWGLNRRVELWEEKVGLRERFAGNPATEWGNTQEACAVESYQKLTGNVVQSLGFKIYNEGDDVQEWLGASPDGLIDEGASGIYEKGGVLEVKCPHNKGRPELCVPWTAVPYYYIPQAQGLMEILDRDWLDLCVWTLNGSTVFRVERDADYWTLIYGVLSDFWWANVVPAKQALLLQKNVHVSIFRPVGLHRLTTDIVRESRVLAMQAPVIWKDQCLNKDPDPDLLF